MPTHSITGGQIAAARALAGISQAKLAIRANVEAAIIRRFEASGTRANVPDQDLAKVCRALEELGVVFIDEKGGSGGGVRLKFSRSQSRAIDTWENEGGVVGEDDVP